MAELRPRQMVVIAGPTGSGESAITNAIVAKSPGKFKRLVTATTRAPRGSEQNGIDYFFFSEEEFLKKQREGEMLEVTHVPNRNVYYGTYAPDLKGKLEAGFIVITNPDIVGAKYFKKNYDAVTIFVEPENIESLKTRLQKRNPSITAEELTNRLENAQRELDNERSFYDHVILNADGKLDKAVQAAIDILHQEGYKF